MAQPLVDADALAALAAQIGPAGPPGSPGTGGPEGSALGRLGEVREWLAGAQGARPHPFQRVVLVSATAQAPADVGAVAEPAGVLLRRIDPASAESALAAGVHTADDEADRGTDLAVLGGPADGLAPMIAVSVLTGSEPAQVLTRGAAACAPDEWMRRAVEVRDTRRRLNALRDQPGQLLAELGSAGLAAAAGFVLRASARRTPLLLDGVLAVVAALVVQRVAPQATGWLQVADTSAEPAHRLASAALGRRPLLALGIERGDGLAGLLAVSVLRAAVACAETERSG